MKLNGHTLAKLSAMVCGEKTTRFSKYFKYRSSGMLTDFFANCDVHAVHDGSTRQWWTEERLKELNEEATPHPDLPSESLIRVIKELMDADHFDPDTLLNPRDDEVDRDQALIELNKALARDHLVVSLSKEGKATIRHDGSGVSSSTVEPSSLPLSKEEKANRERVAAYLDRASEDEITEVVLVPLLQRLGFKRVAPSGHEEKLLEYGKDVWMKYFLPTGHWLYFGVQVKKDKIDSRGKSSDNVSEVLNQARMALGHQVFDPAIGRNVLIDHVYIVSAADITRSARNWIAGRLDTEQRRQVIFMDRKEFLDNSARIVQELPDD